MLHEAASVGFQSENENWPYNEPLREFCYNILSMYNIHENERWKFEAGTV